MLPSDADVAQLSYCSDCLAFLFGGALYTVAGGPGGIPFGSAIFCLLTNGITTLGVGGSIRGGTTTGAGFFSGITRPEAAA